MPASGDVLLDTSVVIPYFNAHMAKAGTPIPENDIWIAAGREEESISDGRPQSHDGGLGVTRLEITTQ